ncbi:carbamoyl-phosphate synthase large subunit [Candidatus Nitronereus thalassa]|uniref:Carbamoyl phosphate synthase large chain n=1 Tax=Candidatus Nitronereus thalassa TaxID=3020898 RepID=A0ABU3K432_9BACT|nr:carbamoyl-phosphate synthase large subunit [Candidatus Nitronereus thalassa]MDT7041123.1 carbamoyl-phosphate synthase large subunit [Candidatus Nitronereus thalassa]
MPKRHDLHRILLIGSGPIVIGQACEFDYSGTQACKALKEDGYEVVLVNSNPATIMTDPDLADRTYVEPITVEVVERIIERERPDALLPTMGGQTALNLTVALHQQGILEKYKVQLIGASYEAIQKAEDRDLFKQAMEKIGISTPTSQLIKHRDEAMGFLEVIGFPAIVRPSFTMGGSGGNIAYNREEFEQYVDWALLMSPVGEVLIERSLIGWKEYELEVMRDLKDNVVIVCPIENFDAMGIHTGDSITVAPAMTLTDKEYQVMRDAALKIIREIGVDTGGSNIQFALNPTNGDMIVIEMNPRVSRSSALASKATGFPIAKIAAKLAIGYTLDEIINDITQVTKASFEPTIDYVVVKIPRFTFEKFLGSDPTLTTQMKSVGEAMALGKNFKEAFHKAIRSLETDRCGLVSLAGIDQYLPGDSLEDEVLQQVKQKIRLPHPDRPWHIADALRLGITKDELYSITHIDFWFLDQLQDLVEYEQRVLRKLRDAGKRRADQPETMFSDADGHSLLTAMKRVGFSDARIGQLIGSSGTEIRVWRKANVSQTVTYARVDTCAAEFEAQTPYLYSTFGMNCEARPTANQKVAILGGGPNRIGQGIEFDYCCVHAALALRELGVETIMVNCNPETVSTDYDISDRLYFEPLTEEDVLNIMDTEQPMGVVVQFGGQTPLKLALPLERAGVPILGTSPDSIDRAEDRERFSDLIKKLHLQQPINGTARSGDEAYAIAKQIGYPVIVRPSYVLGGRAMQIVYDEESLRKYIQTNVMTSSQYPLLIDQYLRDATEVDVDALSDGTHVVVAGIMEHVEEAGIHSGDSACSLPPFSLRSEVISRIREQTMALAKELHVIGLMNIQFAVQNGDVYVLEVNPRASRTVPFVSKTIGTPLAKLAMKTMLGNSLTSLGFTEVKKFHHISVKESVFPFNKFGNVDVLLGPEMRSTGEVMGIDQDFGWAFAKSQAAAGLALPHQGTVIMSVKDSDKPGIVDVARRLHLAGFHVQATRGTAIHLQEHGVTVEMVNKVKEGRPHLVDHIKNRQAQIVVNTVGTTVSQADSLSIRREVLQQGIPYFTTIQGIRAAVIAIESMGKHPLSVQSLQEYHPT